MKPVGFLEKLDDAMNPIVVKELRQAVHSRFVVAVVLLFLLLQLVYLGIHLTYVGIGGRLESIDYQAGRDVFTALQVILLATCMLFLPAYTGARLAAERSEVNTDLLFITTLQPRKIISGKLASSVVIAVMIFSACAPFMAFTYFLRGIDLPSIFFVVAIDFLVVLGSVHLMVLLAVIPANRVFKAFLGVIGFAMLVFIFIGTLSLTIMWVQMGFTPLLEDRSFWSYAGPMLIEYVGVCGLLYTWAVALISAPSSNRAVVMRVFLLVFAIVSGLLYAAICTMTQQWEPFTGWTFGMAQLVILCLVIAINERQTWSPRVTRTIPRNPLLRVPAFLVYSGAAGGVLFAVLLAGIAVLGDWLFDLWYTANYPSRPATFRATADNVFETMGIAVIYIYCYALTAVLVRDRLMRSVQPVYTWVVMIFVIAIGCMVPAVIMLLLYLGNNQWNYNDGFYWLLTNPIAAILEFAGTRRGYTNRDVFLFFATSWAALATLLNVPWFFRQMRAFRPFDGSNTVAMPAPVDGTSSVTQQLTK